MEIPQEILEKIGKQAEGILKIGINLGKSSKKNQTEVEKEFVKVAENVAKRVSSNKNIPDVKKLRGLCSKFLENNEDVSRDSLIKFASDFLATAGSMQKPASKPKTKPDSE